MPTTIVLFKYYTFVRAYWYIDRFRMNNENVVKTNYNEQSINIAKIYTNKNRQEQNNIFFYLHYKT